jgi:hypothetical protein
VPEEIDDGRDDHAAAQSRQQNPDDQEDETELHAPGQFMAA